MRVISTWLSLAGDRALDPFYREAVATRARPLSALLRSPSRGLLRFQHRSAGHRSRADHATGGRPAGVNVQTGGYLVNDWAREMATTVPRLGASSPLTGGPHIRGAVSWVWARRQFLAEALEGFSSLLIWDRTKVAV